MATHCSTRAWRIPGTEEPGGLLSMWSHRVRHDWSDLAAAATGFLFLFLLFIVVLCVSLGCLSDKAMATHSRTLAWKIPWTEEPGRLQSMGSLELDTTEWLHFDFSLSCIGEGNGNPLQCSCLENPGDGRAWWAVVYRVAQGRTRLKWLSSSSNRFFVSFSHFFFPQGGLDCYKLHC